MEGDYGKPKIQASHGTLYSGGGDALAGYSLNDSTVDRENICALGVFAQEHRDKSTALERAFRKAANLHLSNIGNNGLVGYRLDRDG